MTTRAERLSTRSSKELLRFILKTVYNEAVTNPDELNEYRPFSPSVIIKIIKKKKVDLLYFLNYTGLRRDILRSSVSNDR